MKEFRPPMNFIKRKSAKYDMKVARVAPRLDNMLVSSTVKAPEQKGTNRSNPKVFIISAIKDLTVSCFVNLKKQAGLSRATINIFFE